MNLTQAAVSKYLNQPLSTNPLANEIDTLTRKLIEIIMSGDADSDILVREICSSCMHSRVGSTLCELHQSKVPSLKVANCQICAQLLGGSDTELSKKAIIIGDVLDALRILEASDSFVNLVPQIRANIVVCDDTALSVKDVASIPGRITVIDGRARAPVNPQFGASSHTAELLLKARELWPSIHSCLYISGKDSVVTRAGKIGFKVAKLPNSESSLRKIISILKSLQKIPGPRTAYPAIHDPGGFGVEPILYTFGPTAKQLSEKCVKVGESLRE
jgi:predicted fused transcriptional regulator/phosphomethylpyrimidine kinase/predicted transcriptional regulator